jgi:hypothetical protein
VSVTADGRCVSTTTNADTLSNVEISRCREEEWLVFPEMSFDRSTCTGFKDYAVDDRGLPGRRRTLASRRSHSHQRQRASLTTRGTRS